MGVFEFVIVLVALSMIGKIVGDIVNTRRLPPGSGQDDAPRLAELQEFVADLGTRLHALEEERDFYRQLLEAPADDDVQAEAEGNPGGST